MTLLKAELEVPTELCVVSDLMITPYTNEERMKELSHLASHGGALPYPMARHKNEHFEVFQGWDVVELLRSRGEARIRVLCAEYTDADVLRYGVVDQARILGLHWFEIARALASAKAALGWSDQALSKATDIERSKLTRYIKFAKRLAPRFHPMVTSDRLSFTACRSLVKLSLERQAALAQEAAEQQWSEKRLLEKAFPSPSLGEPATQYGKSVALPHFQKTSDMKRLEITLSEEIGYPVEITPADAAGKSGSIAYEFFDRRGMVDVLTRLRRGFRHNAAPQGQIVIQYTNLDEFDALTGALFEDE